MTDRPRPTDEKVSAGMSQLAERMLSQRETEWGTPTRAMSDEERRRAYVLAAVIIVGTIAAGLILSLVLIALDG